MPSQIVPRHLEPVGVLSGREFASVTNALAIAIRRSGNRWGIESAIVAANRVLAMELYGVEVGRERSARAGQERLSKRHSNVLAFISRGA